FRRVLFRSEGDAKASWHGAAPKGEGPHAAALRSVTRDVASLLPLQPRRDGRAQVARRLDRGDTRLLQRGELAGGGTLAAGGDGAGMAHALAGRSRRAGDEADHRLADMGGDELGRLLLGAAADLADHDDALGLRVVLEQLQGIDEVHALDRVAADADAGALAQAGVGGLLDRLVGQG